MSYRLGSGSIIAGALFALCTATAHAKECTDDSDCQQGSECIKGTPPDSCRGPSCDASVAEAETGECSRVRMTCEVDADCADGLTCRVHGEGTGSCSRLPDGGMQCEETTTSEGECEYEPAECEQTSECDDGYLCTVLGAGQECSGGGVACSAPPGSDAGCAPPEPPEETCTTIERKFCFPPRVDCKADSDCKKGLRCVDLPEDFRDDASGDWKGATRVCMPEGVALAIEGSVSSGGVASSDDATSGTDKGGRGTAEDTGGANLDEATHGTTHDAGASDAGAPNTSQADDSDCTVSAPGTGGSAHAVAPIALLAGLAVLRRRRRRSIGGIAPALRGGAR